MNAMNQNSFIQTTSTVPSKVLPTILSLAEAISSGVTPSMMRTMANSLERIARANGEVELVWTDARDQKRTARLEEMQNFDRRQNLVNAGALRALAKILSKTKV